jgi:uncharacterized protein (DUF4213/DUF364 family)
MSIITEFSELFNSIKERIKNCEIKEVIFPKKGESDPTQRYNNFGAIRLEDNSVGIVYLGLSEETKKKAQEYNTTELEGKNPFDLVKEINSNNLFQKILGFGALNAISQFIFNTVGYKFDFTTDSMGLLNLDEGDLIGMVGFFPPLIKRIKNMDIPLIVIEKKERLVQKHKNWEVTLEPSKLKNCNKVLCTSSTVLNNSLDDILKYANNAEKISIIGPTAGFLPDPLFERGVDVIGGTYVSNPALFMDLIRQNKKWGPSTRKYCMQAKTYPGSKSLLL